MPSVSAHRLGKVTLKKGQIPQDFASKEVIMVKRVIANRTLSSLGLDLPWLNIVNKKGLVETTRLHMYIRSMVSSMILNLATLDFRSKSRSNLLP